MDSKRKSVKKWSQVELPEGLIESYKVVSPSKLAAVVKAALSRAGIMEKSVGIIVPEFSTFSKLVSLPKLAVSELKEAVFWQAQEYLPDAGNDMIIDWKVVGRKGETVDVLLVAIQKDVLVGYVEACELAGLFPQGVETPSLCLTNLNSEAGGVLIFYAGYGEAILIAAKGEKVLGTSALSSTNGDEAVETASKMLNHYKSAEITKVLICGSGMNDNLVTNIKTQLKRDVSILKAGASGIDLAKAEDMIIPISMQFRELRDPGDPRSVNLMPGSLLEKYKFRKNKVQVWSLTLTVTLFTWFCMLIVLGSYIVATQQISSLKNRNAENLELAERIKNYESEAKKINDIASKALKIKVSYVVPQTVLNVITSSKPEGVSIEKYGMDFDKGLIELTGTSSDRDSLLKFKDNLEKKDNVTSVNIPISSFEEIRDLDFTLSFSYGAKIGEPVNQTPDGGQVDLSL